MSLLSRLLSRSIPAATKPHTPARPRLGVQQLEARDVPAGLDFLSGFGVGDAGGENGSQARDVAVDAAGNRYLTGLFCGLTDFDPGHTHAGDADILTARGYSDAFVAKYAPDDSLVWVRQMGGDDLIGANGFITDVGQKIAIDGSGNAYVTGWFTGTADFGSVSRTSAGETDGFVAKLDASGTVQWANRWGVAIKDNGLGVDVDAAGNVYALGTRWDGTETTTSQSGYDVMKFAPTGAAVWSKWFATKNITTSGDLDVDAAGNVFVGGQFRYTVDFDPGTGKRDVYSVSSGASRAGFVLKLTTNGAFGWASAFASQGSGTTAGSSVVQSLAVDGGGNVVVGGYYRNAVDFNPGTGTTTLPTVGGGFVAKLNATGGLTWARVIESTSSVFVYGLAVDAAGSVYATGTHFGTADFDPGIGTDSRTAAGTNDAYALKLTSAGNYAWAETFGGTGNDIGWGIAVDASGFVHLTGSFQGTVDFDPDPTDTFNLTTPGTKDNMYLVRLRQS
jgi:hypothetical protein